MNILRSCFRGASASLLLLGLAAGEEAVPVREGEAGDRVLVYPLEGVLDASLAESLRLEVEGYLRKTPEIRALILKINSPGTRNGELAPAEVAARFLAELRGVRVIAWVRKDRAAGNASALLALAAQDLVLSPGGQVGYLPQRPDERLELDDSDEKAAEKAKKAFQDLAWKRRVSPHLAAAMISGRHPPILKVKFEKVVGNNLESEFRFLTAEEVANLPPADKQRQRPPDTTIVKAGEKLTLTQATAGEYGFGVPIGSDDLSDLLHKLNLPVGPENIIDHSLGGTALKTLSPEAQNVVDFLNHPVVRFLLILCGTLGLLLEIKLPGTLVPSLSGLVCFAVFLIAGLFRPSDANAPPTSLQEILLFVVGLGLLGVELLLLPGVIIFGLSGAAVCLISLVLAMVPPSGAGTADSLNFKEALTVLITSAGASAVIFLFLLRFLPHSGYLDRSGIVMHSAIQGTPTADSAIEAQTRSAALIGRMGQALTHLRPSGAMEVDGERLDVVAEGDFVEKGEKVEIIEADGTRTVVRKV